MKHRRTQALEIPPKVKKIVFERDHHQCVLCKKYVDVSNACCHYIARSQGGLGIEENILTLCQICHRNYDNTDKRQEIKQVLSKYLKSKYADWEEEKLVYKKWKF